MARLSDIASTGYFSQEDFKAPNSNAPVVVTISGIEDGELPDGKPQRVLIFDEDDRKLGLNITRWRQVAEACDMDPETADDEKFIGHKIEVYFDPSVMMGKKRVGGMRVRKPSGAAARPARPAAPASRPAASAPADLPADDMPADEDVTPDSTPQMTKEQAWHAFKAIQARRNPAPNSAEVAKSWKDAVAARRDEVGRTPEQFTAEDWGVIGTNEIPF
jgi:hypothetical protein